MTSETRWRQQASTEKISGTTFHFVHLHGFADESRWRQPEHYHNPRTPGGRTTIAHPSEVVQGPGAECDVTFSQTFIGGHLGLGDWAGYLGTLYTTSVICDLLLNRRMATWNLFLVK